MDRNYNIKTEEIVISGKRITTEELGKRIETATSALEHLIDGYDRVFGVFINHELMAEHKALVQDLLDKLKGATRRD